MKHNGAAYHKMPDKVLMAAFQEGDERSYIELYQRYEQRITSFLFGFQNSFSRAVKVEDLVQQTFAKLYTHKNTYNERRAAFSTWLFTIAGNFARTEIRTFKRRKTCSLDGLLENERPNLSVDGGFYGDLIKEIESRGYVDLGMERFQEFFNEHIIFGTILLLRGQGLDYQMIADIMKTPLGTVKSRINRARKYLRNSYY